MKTPVLKTLLITAVFASTVCALHAAAKEFDFTDPKGVNNVQFSLDAPLESITGTATGISGKVSFDPAHPARTIGRIVLETSSLMVGNPVMREHLHGRDWMNVAEHPTIIFELSELRNARTEGNRTHAEAIGTITIKGISRELVVPVSLTHLPDRLGARMGNPDLAGDLLVLRAEFSVARSDFGIQAGRHLDTVAEEIQLSLAIAGAAPVN